MAQSTVTSTVTEGKATVTFLGESSVFYNPVQEFNRDISILIIRQFLSDYQNAGTEQVETFSGDGNESKAKRVKLGDQGQSVRILEALAASGLRAIRYALEIPGVEQVVANDFSEQAVQCIRDNVARNNLQNKVQPNYADAVSLMHEHRKFEKRFLVVDLDPYGSPSHFLDAAVQSVADGGLLLVTCTDVAVLCGNAIEACHSKYGSTSVRSKSCHEMALRILLRCIESHANRYSRYITPLISISVDFYVRVALRIHTGQARVKESICKISMVYQCSGCESFHLQPMGEKVTGKQGSAKYVLATGPIVGERCPECDHKYHMGGPVWSHPLHCPDFVSSLLASAQDSSMSDSVPMGTSKRIIGILSVISEELHDVPLYYIDDRLCSLARCSVPKMRVFRSALLNAGYRVSISHAAPRAIKTDAPVGVLWDIVRCWARECKVKWETFPDSSCAKALLSKLPKFEANFTPHVKADARSRMEGLLRFQPNPEPNWGPMARAKKGQKKDCSDNDKAENGSEPN